MYTPHTLSFATVFGLLFSFGVYCLLCMVKHLKMQYASISFSNIEVHFYFISLALVLQYTGTAFYRYASYSTLFFTRLPYTFRHTECAIRCKSIYIELIYFYGFMFNTQLKHYINSISPSLLRKPISGQICVACMRVLCIRTVCSSFCTAIFFSFLFLFFFSFWSYIYFTYFECQPHTRNLNHEAYTLWK